MTEEQLYDRVPLSPPYVANVHACGEKVLATGVHEDATATLYIDGNQVDSAPGNAVGKVEFDDVPPLRPGMELTARQVLDNNSSAMSNERVVQELHKNLPKPVIPYDIWECGQKVTAQAQVPGTKMRLHLGDDIVAEDFTTDRWRNDKWPMLYQPGLPKGESVSVDMVYCPGTEDEEISPLSEASSTKESPSTLELDSVTAYAETDRLWLEGTYVGAEDSFYKNGDYLFNSLSIFGDFYRMNMGNMWTVGEDDEFRVTTELCPGTAGSGTVAENTSTEYTLSLLDLVTLEAPLCPKADVIRVKTPLPTGHIVVFVNDEMVQVQPVSGDPTVIDVSDLDLNQGDVVGVRQYLSYDGGMHESEISTVKIDEDSNHSLEVTSQTTVENPISGDEFGTFVRDGEEMSAGPKFEYTCCTSCDCRDCSDMGYQCDDGHAPVRELELRLWTSIVGEDDDWETTVTLYEETRGRFTGRWDWTDSSEVPPAGMYFGEVLDSPCEGEGAEVPKWDWFPVVIGEGDTDAVNPPTHVQLSVQDASNDFASVTNESGDNNMTVDTNGSFDVTLMGHDPWDGVKKVEIFGQGDIDVDPQEITFENEAPIGGVVGMESVHSRLDPGQQVALQGRVIDWGDNVLETDVLYLKGEPCDHEEPVIDSVLPLYPETDGEITIEGTHLISECDDSQTIVYFTVDGVQKSVHEDDFGSGSTHSTLVDVPIPDEFSDANGESGEIRVRTVTSQSSKLSSGYDFTFQYDCTQGTQRVRLEKSSDFMHTFEKAFKNPLAACGLQPAYVTHVTNPTNAYGSINNDCDVWVDIYDFIDWVQYPFAGPVGPGETWAGVNNPNQTLDLWWVGTVVPATCDGIPDRLYLDFHWVTN